MVVKLCDFGFSKDEDRNSGSKSGCGTPEYVAPEVRRQAPARVAFPGHVPGGAEATAEPRRHCLAPTPCRCGLNLRQQIEESRPRKCRVDRHPSQIWAWAKRLARHGSAGTGPVPSSPAQT